MKSIKFLKFFFITFILSLYIVLFVSIDVKKPDSGLSFKVGNSYVNLFNINGYSTFKKGLDIAGGVRLTYKVDFSKYKETYKDEFEYNKMKNQAVDIILANIDGRISKLGVSDYSANLQNINGEDYIIVEIGGLKDIEQGKEVIGKTVELEFKLPYQDANTKTSESDRKSLAEGLLQTISTSPDMISSLTDGKIVSDEIYYNNYIEAPSYILPDFYKSMVGQFDSMQSGQVVNKLTDVVYDGQYLLSFMNESEISYYLQSTSNEYYEPVSGWLITKYNGKSQRQTDILEEIKFQQVIKDFGLTYTLDYSEDSKGLSEKKYEIVDNSLNYLESSIYSGEAAYDLEIYSIQNPSSLGISPEEKVKNDEQIMGITNQVKDIISSGETVNLTGVTSVHNGWISLSQIKEEIVTFNYDGSNDLLTFQELNTTYIVNVKQEKKVDANLYKMYTVKDIPSDKIDSLKSSLDVDYLYNIEDVLVANSPKWIAATDPQTGKILNGAFFKYSGVTQDQVGRPAVQINFNEEGQLIFCNLTKKYIGKRMAIFVGGELVTSPTIQDEICGGQAIINGDYTTAEAKSMSNNLNEGALPAKLIPAHEEQVSPSLGQTALNGAIIASFVGLGLIYLFMIYLYGVKLATVAMMSLVTYLFILMALLKIMGYSLSLSGISAIILCIGMGVDANVLIFERMKEELKLGKSYQSAILDGYERSWPAIRDGNFTTFFIGLLLLVIGTNLFKGFGTMLIVNILLTLIVIVPATKAYLQLFYKNK
ncbi:MAG: protein translocase subunit SecD [Candidatus Absconditabacteria bacterium]